jgi:hypothetical protein
VFVVSVPESGVPHHTSVYAAANEQGSEVTYTSTLCGHKKHRV